MYKFIFKLIVALITTISCKKETDIDTEKPIINNGFAGAFPVNCDTLYFGETFNFVALLADNAELGSVKAFSIDVHHNFDHHSHSTDVSACNIGPKKAPVNPYLFIGDFNIPEALQTYQANLPIAISAGNSKGLFDEGDYHFFISLTDRQGWSAQKGISIKILHR